MRTIVRSILALAISFLHLIAAPLPSDLKPIPEPTAEQLTAATKEVDSAGYHYVVIERGQEQSRYSTADFDDLLYQIFQSITFSLACEHESAHRVAAGG